MTAAPEIDRTTSNQLTDGSHRRGQTFASLRTRNFRLFLSGLAISNTGAWVQRIAQDWLVLTITGSPTAVGITTALQFLPTLLFGMVGGLVADRYPKRTILLGTQAGMSAMATVLAVLTLCGHVQVWQIYLIAFGLGTVIAVDNPTRQSFVNEMVGPAELRNAVALNASVFQLGALVGPGVSGLLVGVVGVGWAFAINAASYVGPIIALARIREADLHREADPPGRNRGQLREAVRHIRSSPTMLWPIVLVGSFGTFSINLPVTLSAYAKDVFHSGAAGYGLLTSAVAAGSLAGALLAAGRSGARLRSIVAVGGALAVVYVIIGFVPSEVAFLALLAVLGALTLLLITAANTTVQLSANGAIRGRVMGAYVLVFIGSGAVGGPLLGLVDQHFSPQLGMTLSGVVPGLVTAFVAVRLARIGDLRLSFQPLRRPTAPVSIVPR